MTDHGNESERTANGANQSANGGPPRGADARRQLGCSPERTRPSPAPTRRRPCVWRGAARPHLRGEGGPGRNEGTGPRGAGHRRR